MLPNGKKPLILRDLISKGVHGDSQGLAEASNVSLLLCGKQRGSYQKEDHHEKTKLKTGVCLILVLALFLSGYGVKANGESDGSEGFVLLSEAVPDVILEVRYYSTYNFVGERVDGYE